MALASKLEDIFSEGLEARYLRHATLAQQFLAGIAVVDEVVVDPLSAARPLALRRIAGEDVHVLHALLHQTETVVVPVLQKVGVNIARLRAALRLASPGGVCCVGGWGWGRFGGGGAGAWFHSRVGAGQ